MASVSGLVQKRTSPLYGTREGVDAYRYYPLPGSTYGSGRSHRAQCDACINPFALDNFIRL